MWPLRLKQTKLLNPTETVAMMWRISVEEWATRYKARVKFISHYDKGEHGVEFDIPAQNLSLRAEGETIDGASHRMIEELTNAVLKGALK